MTALTETENVQPQSRAEGPLRDVLLPGALAGIAGGLVFGAAMGAYGALPTVASIVRADSPLVGFIVHMVIAAILGAVFASLVARHRAQVGELLFWGLAYGAFWWFLGPQTLLPLLRGRPVAWDLAAAQALLPSLIGHLFYGAVTALALVAIRQVAQEPIRPVTVLRGVAAGLITTLLFTGFVAMAGVPMGWLPVIGAVMGLIYPLLFTGQSEGTGPAVIRGTAFGFLTWVVADLTLPPLLAGRTLDWSQAAASAAAGRLPAYLLLGAAMAAVFTWLGALGRGLFVDDIRMFHREAAGARGLRALAHGILAGLAGGLVFTVVMVGVGALPTVARLVGAETAAAGLIVHLVIAQIVGVSYAILFRRRSFDAASGLGWGVSYGFVWWVLGGLTLLPLLLGAEPRWNAAAMAAAFPSLVGHLAYGAALGTIHYHLEARANPWWITRNQVEAERVAARQRQILGSAPALWVFTVIIALIIPLLVTGQGQ